MLFYCIYMTTSLRIAFHFVTIDNQLWTENPFLLFQSLNRYLWDVCYTTFAPDRITLKYLFPYSSLFSPLYVWCVNRYHGYVRKIYTSWRRKILCFLVTKDLPSYINPTWTSGILKLSMRHWRIRGCMNARWTRSRKSNYQFSSKWQVRVQNVRKKFVVLVEEGKSSPENMKIENVFAAMNLF